jgi:hypothetical protein
MNQLHALLRQLLAGGASTSLTASAATSLLRNFRAKSAVERMRVGLCRDLIADIRRLDDQLAANEKRMTEALHEHGTRLREVDGIGDRRPADRPHRPPRSLPDRGGLCELQRVGTGADRQRRHRPAPTLPLRRPTAQTRPGPTFRSVCQAYHQPDPRPCGSWRPKVPHQTVSPRIIASAPPSMKIV